MAFAARHFLVKHVAVMQQPMPAFYTAGHRAALQFGFMPPAAMPMRAYADMVPPPHAAPAMYAPVMGMAPMPIPGAMRAWTSEERSRLKSAVLAQRRARGTFGPEFWEQLSKQMGRLPQECAYQWRYHENPESQEGWTPQEDAALINLVMALQEYQRSGNPWSRYPLEPARSWRDVARALPGRTDEACRRRFAFLVQNDIEGNALTTGVTDEVHFDENGAFHADYEDDDEEGSQSHARAQATQDKFISLIANYVRFYHMHICNNGENSMVPPLKQALPPGTAVAPLIDVGAYLNRIAGWSKYYKHRNSGLAAKLHMYGHGVVEVVEALDDVDAAQTPRLYVAFAPITTQRRYERIQHQLYDFDDMTAKTVREIRSFIKSYSEAYHKQKAAGGAPPASQLTTRQAEDGSVIVEVTGDEPHDCELPENAAWSIDLGRHLKQQHYLEYIKLYGTLTTFLKTVAPNEFIITGDQRDQHIALAKA